MMLPSVLLIILLLVAEVIGQTFKPIRINCGGPKYVDPATNITWLAESSGFNVGNKGGNLKKCTNSTTAIANATATLQNLYCCHRFFRSVGSALDVEPFQYSIPVLNITSSYTVRLHFAEIVRA
jgi:Malectin domain